MGKLYVDMALPFEIDLAFDLDAYYSFFVVISVDGTDIYSQRVHVGRGSGTLYGLFQYYVLFVVSGGKVS